MGRTRFSNSTVLDIAVDHSHVDTGYGHSVYSPDLRQPRLHPAALTAFGSPNLKRNLFYKVCSGQLPNGCHPPGMTRIAGASDWLQVHTVSPLLVRTPLWLHGPALVPPWLNHVNLPSRSAWWGAYPSLHWGLRQRSLWLVLFTPTFLSYHHHAATACISSSPLTSFGMVLVHFWIGSSP